MKRALRAIEKCVNHPLVSTAGNVQTLIKGGALVAAAILAAVGLLASMPALLAIAIVLFAIDLVLFIVFVVHNKSTGDDAPADAPVSVNRQVFVAVEAEVALGHEEALEMIKLLRAEWPHITVDGALVQTALPDWRAKTGEFIGTTLGSARRAAFKASATGPNELERLESEARFLSQLALGLDETSIRVNEPEFLTARSTRRTHAAAGFLNYENHRAPGAPPVDLRRRIDELMRRGMNVVDELSESVVPEETKPGVWQISGGEAPEEWWKKADDLFQEARNLLKDHQPALLKDFEEGYNRKFRPTDSPEPAEQSPDRRSDPEKMLAFANSERSRPKLIVEATLDGLTEARRRLGV